MAPTAAQFSPGQILEAGRRAENDGRIGYAIQFYRHLADHHGWSPEAAIAKEALSRLANFRPDNGPASTGNLPPQPMPAPQFGAPHYATQQPAAHPGFQPGTSQPQWAAAPGGPGQPFNSLTVGQSTAYTPTTTGQRGSSLSDRPLRLPAAERRYRVGSVVAWLLFSIGLLLMAASLILIGLHSVGVKVPGTLGTMLGFTGGLPGALAIFTVGLTQVFAAQIGRALFDNANAMCDLAMIERAKISYAAGDQPPNTDADEPA